MKNGPGLAIIRTRASHHSPCTWWENRSHFHPCLLLWKVGDKNCYLWAAAGMRSNVGEEHTWSAARALCAHR